jgi:Kdo2-lipid IVA lauroyltransferase/acyltransferase
MRMDGFGQRIVHFAIFVLIWVFLTLAKHVPFHTRSRLGGALVKFASVIVPGIRKRIEGNIVQVFPEMPQEEVRALLNRNTRTMGRTLTEILFNEDQLTHHFPFHVSGEGLDAIKSADEAGQGVILVSGHFGQWDATRIFLKEQGLETGAIYRPNNNIYYEPYFLRGIEAAGKPIFSKGADGLKGMIRHLRKGGRVAILADQHLNEGARLPLLGRPSMTTLSPAQLAIRHNALLVPVWSVRDDDAACVNILLEAPIRHGTPEEMMTVFNERLEAQVRAFPEQWLWAHRRWKNHGSHTYKTRSV